MAKIISDKYVEKDDPIFTGRYTVNNPNVVKKRVFEEKKRERFQNRILMGMFFLSITILGYIVV